MKKKQRIGILFGGRSGEHEVSLLSAASILKAIDKKKYEVVPIGITKQGRWVTASDAHDLLVGRQAPENPRLAGDPAATPTAAVIKKGEAVIIPPVPAESLQPLEMRASSELARSRPALDLDVIFPVLHRTFGEDGTIQGLFELADIAYVGSGVLGSAAGMDKAAMKRLFAAAGLPQTLAFSCSAASGERTRAPATKKIEAALKYPIFVKPANLGSSVGISKVHDRSELAAAMDLAASFDRKLVIEQGVGGQGAKPREPEVAGSRQRRLARGPPSSARSSPEPSSTITKPSTSPTPACPSSRQSSTAAESKQIRQMAVEAFKACDCAGLARVDFLMEPAKKGRSRRIFLQRDQHSTRFHLHQHVYPKLWEATSLPYKQLIDRLIQLANERHGEEAANAVLPRLTQKSLRPGGAWRPLGKPSAVPARRPKSAISPVLASAAAHLVVLGVLIYHGRHWIAPVLYPGTEHGHNIVLTYLPGRAPRAIARSRPEAANERRQGRGKSSQA